MNHTLFETLSNQAVAACAVTYFLVLLAQLAAAVTRPSTTRTAVQERELVGAGGPPVTEPAAPTEGDRSALFSRVAVAIMVVAAFVHLLALVFRGLAANPIRVPWGNMYEFTLTATFIVVALFLITYKRFQLSWLAPIITIFVLAVLMTDVVVLYEPITPLRDALQSPWLVIHVVSAIIATGSLTLGGMCSVLYLVKKRASSRGEVKGYLARVPSLESLDRLAYRWHAFAFPLWTFAALIAGPIWAHYAWGKAWGWDPKEIWALITWIVYAAYLHARATAGWKGSRAAIVALVGLATLWFNFIGINYFFGSGSMHSYAAPAPHSVVRTL